MRSDPSRSGFRHAIRSLLLPLLLATGLVALAACDDGGGEDRAPARKPAQDIGLVTSLPIYWRETGDIAQVLADDRPPHWTLGVLREAGTVTPLDTLAGPGGTLPLPHDALLVLAQPFPLAPHENVALDGWVRAGGRVLVFADPMLTAESVFPLGDRRRPQDVVLLSPILKRWGLELRFDETQPPGEREITGRVGKMPVNLAGFFAPLPGGPDCTLDAGGLIAACRIGKGRVVALADAAVLEERSGPQAELRASVLRQLIAQLRQ